MVSSTVNLVYFFLSQPQAYNQDKDRRSPQGLGYTLTYPSLGLIANGTLENVDLYRQLGELLGQNHTKI